MTIEPSKRPKWASPDFFQAMLKHRSRSFYFYGRIFDGRYLTSLSLKSEAGVYVIWEFCAPDQWRVLDVGESDRVQSRLRNHEREEQWSRACMGTLYFSATYTPDLTPEQRKALEHQIRLTEKPCCGER